MSIDRWMNKEDMVYIHMMKYYLAIKKNEIMPLEATWMDLKIIILNEVQVRKRKTNTIWYHLYVDPKIGYKWIYLQNRNRFIDLENQRERQWGREKLGVWD